MIMLIEWCWFDDTSWLHTLIPVGSVFFNWSSQEKKLNRKLEIIEKCLVMQKALVKIEDRKMAPVWFESRDLASLDTVMNIYEIRVSNL